MVAGCQLAKKLSETNFPVCWGCHFRAFRTPDLRFRSRHGRLLFSWERSLLCVRFRSICGAGCWPIIRRACRSPSWAASTPPVRSGCGGSSDGTTRRARSPPGRRSTTACLVTAVLKPNCARPSPRTRASRSMACAPRWASPATSPPSGTPCAL